MNSPEMSEVETDQLIAALDSLVDGDFAVARLIVSGKRAIPYLERFLLEDPPRAIALPRCRAVRALGELAACTTLISYLREYKRPSDAVVMFAEDAVRSAVAGELLRWRTEEVFQALLSAVSQRATADLVLALAEFHRPESVPLLFDILEDDLCREEAKEGLRKVPDAARQYAIPFIRGATPSTIAGPAALRRRRATVQLLAEFGVSLNEWEDVRPFLLEKDPALVIAAAQIGARVAPSFDQSQIVSALLNISRKLNCLQERDILQLLDAHHDVAYEAALRTEQVLRDRGEQSTWLSPLWRIVRHVLDKEPERGHYGAI